MVADLWQDPRRYARMFLKMPGFIFAPGGGMKALTYHALLEDLASHGWVVAAVDPPYNARAVRFPDGRVLGNLQPAERGWPQPRNREETQRYYQERIVQWSRDISFVIDKLTALDSGNGPFARRLDLKRGVGVFGHSRGGQAAGAVRMLDERVRGGINIDGVVRGELERLLSLTIFRPYKPLTASRVISKVRRISASVWAALIEPCLQGIGKW